MPMARLAPSLAAALALCCFAPLTAPLAPEIALAQDQGAAPPIKQMALTDAQVQAYLAAETAMEPLLAKMPQDDSAPLDPKLLVALDAAAKKNGFASIDEFQDIGANIDLVMDGIDPATKKYVGAGVLLKQELASTQADPKLAPADKKQAVEEINEALKSVEPLQNAGNADLVLKYYDKLAASDPQHD
jgi:hypothetical protein